MPRRSQDDRRTDTRARLLRAAGALFAARGVDAVPVDAVAEEAGRTSGALYAHFGSKHGLVSALLDAWKDEAASAVAAEFAASSDPATRLGALWSSFADPGGELGAAWSLLEHELWLRAARDPDLAPVFAKRYAWSRRRLADGVASDRAGGVPADTLTSGDRATLVLALLLGLEMQRRLDPSAVPDSLAVAGLQRVLGATTRPTTEEEDDHAHAAL